MEKYKVIDRSKDTASSYSMLNKGMVPGIVYGKGTEPTKIAFENKVLQKLMHTGSFYSTIIDIDIEGKVEKVLPKQLQYHPVTDKLIHFDFLRVQDDTKVTVEIPVDFLNQDTCPGLKKGGVLNLVRRLVELSCNANKIPEKLQFVNYLTTWNDGKFSNYTEAGPPLGIMSKIKYKETTIKFSDSSMYIFTDGITEIKDPSGEMLGAEGFQNYIKKHQDKPSNERLRIIVEDIVKSGKIQKDDLTVVVIDSI